MTALWEFLSWLGVRVTEGYCPSPKDDEVMHCDHWFECEPCHWCGFDGGGEDCDCPRHTAQRVAS